MKQSIKPNPQITKISNIHKNYFKNTKIDTFKLKSQSYQTLEQKIKSFSKANDNLFKKRRIQIQNRQLQKKKSQQQKRFKHLIMRKKPNYQIFDIKSTRYYQKNQKYQLHTQDSSTTIKLFIQNKKSESRMRPYKALRSNSYYKYNLPQLKIDQFQLQNQKQLKNIQSNQIISALWKTKNILVCIKQIKTKLNNLIDIQHKNFIKIFGTLNMNKKRYAIISEQARYSLKNLIKQFGRLSQHLVIQIIKQLVQGLKQLHYHKLYHNKLSLQNIFYQPSGKILIDISEIQHEIGFSTLKSYISNSPNNISDYQKTSTKHVFTQANDELFINYYNPPQSLISFNSKYSQTNKDIWSLGCITLQLLHGPLDRRNKNHPYNFSETQTLKNNFCQESIKIIKQINEQFQPIDYSQKSDNSKQFFNLSKQIQKFVKYCLTINNQQKSSIQQLAMFSFIKN